MTRDPRTEYILKKRIKVAKTQEMTKNVKDTDNIKIKYNYKSTSKILKFKCYIVCRNANTMVVVFVSINLM